MNIAKKIALCGAVAAAATTVEGFAPLSSSPVQLRKWQSAPSSSSASSSSSALRFFGGGSGAKDLDEQWEAQQELLRLRQASPAERERYFKSVEDRRIAATEEQIDKWAWQRREYARGEDPIDEWRKRRASGQISDLENQYGDPRTVGGIPIPSASFGGELVARARVTRRCLHPPQPWCYSRCYSTDLLTTPRSIPYLNSSMTVGGEFGVGGKFDNGGE